MPWKNERADGRTGRAWVWLAGRLAERGCVGCEEEKRDRGGTVASHRLQVAPGLLRRTPSQHDIAAHTHAATVRLPASVVVGGIQDREHTATSVECSRRRRAHLLASLLEAVPTLASSSNSSSSISMQLSPAICSSSSSSSTFSSSLSPPPPASPGALMDSCFAKRRSRTGILHRIGFLLAPH